MDGFSILVPVYNGERFLRQCLDSVLPQLGPNDELLVHDDGSTDSTRDILAGYGSKIRWSSGHNQGVSLSRNLLIERASGRWVLFLDADDLILPDALETFREHFRRSPAPASLTPIHFFDDESPPREGRVFFEEASGVAGDPILFFLRWIPPTSSLCVERKLLLETRGFHPSICHSEELDLAVKLCALGCQWNFQPKPVRANRLHGHGRASENLNLCCWNAIRIGHRLSRGRYKISINRDHKVQLFRMIRDHGRILYRFGDRELARHALDFADKLNDELGEGRESVFDRLCNLLGHYRGECVRHSVNQLLIRDASGNSKVPRS
jgi:glycosyltransferase involved in cell wall biosynthesis